MKTIKNIFNLGYQLSVLYEYSSKWVVLCVPTYFFISSPSMMTSSMAFTIIVISHEFTAYCIEFAYQYFKISYLHVYFKCLETYFVTDNWVEINRRAGVKIPVVRLPTPDKVLSILLKSSHGSSVLFCCISLTDSKTRS